jgi:hypothetical protein
MAKIHEAIADIMAEVGSIKKERSTNNGPSYKFRGIDDVYLAVHDLFVKHGVFSVPSVESERSEERITKSGVTLIYRVLKIRYEFFARDGSSISATVIGEGMDSGDKASNKAMSVAHKYAILQLLAIPTEDTVDPEVDSHEIAPKKKPDIIGSTPDNLKRAGELTVELSISKEEKARILAASGNDVSKYIAKLEDMKSKRDAPEATFGTPEEQVAELFGGKK